MHMYDCNQQALGSRGEEAIWALMITAVYPKGGGGAHAFSSDIVCIINICWVPIIIIFY